MCYGLKQILTRSSVIYLFSGMPGGYRHDGDDFNDRGFDGYCWSSTDSGGGSAWSEALSYGNLELFGDDDGKLNGMSVRCIKNRYLPACLPYMDRGGWRFYENRLRYNM